MKPSTGTWGLPDRTPRITLLKYRDNLLIVGPTEKDCEVGTRDLLQTLGIVSQIKRPRFAKRK